MKCFDTYCKSKLNLLLNPAKYTDCKINHAKFSPFWQLQHAIFHCQKLHASDNNNIRTLAILSTSKYFLEILFFFHYFFSSAFSTQFSIGEALAAMDGSGNNSVEFFIFTTA